MIKHTHQIKVYYRDVDKMGIVYYSRYFEYFEESRTELFSSIGLNVSSVEDEGITLPVISSHCDFKTGAKFEEKILIKTWIDEKPRSTLKINYEAILNSTYVLLAKGYTVHAFLGKNGKPKRPPKKILVKLNN
tara:strand:- start:290 stop:688 length:399 start_codon:yes stop_codon:yes gene_type:complete